VIVENAEPRSWVMLLTRVPTEPARHRMALWRELRRSGALLIGPSAWVVPDLPVATELIERVSRLVEPVGGTLLTLSSTGHSAVDAERLETLYLQAREEEWSEFLADCGKYLAELAKEESLAKYTLAELEEEEQSLDRLRRWYRELRSRDLLGAASLTEATAQLRTCQEQFDRYAEHVYDALNGAG
jgi:DNA-binding transcriptional regulator PaaX